ncbi:MAG TPA: bifunctional phosphoglucose/phosphomannose isomerase [Solirubrobacteraceae bacterium]|nr:bifunctional phosphoglucose/phosphomannose isomerase [Solirubrobacteraceae bacterium]
MSTTTTLDPETVSAGDPTDQFAEALNLSEHLRDALWRVESAEVSSQDSPGGLVIAGMGGSAIGGLLARAVLGDRASRPIVIARDYALPAWTTPDTTVLCASYSGETEETLAAFDAAGAVGARRIVSTTGGTLAASAREEGVPVIPIPGGFQPRAAVGYGLVVALEVAALSGAAPSLRTEIDVAAAHADALAGEWGPGAPEDSLAKHLARSLHGAIPIITGSGLTAPIAYRWKTQFNENAKSPAFAGELPEIDHNEIVGWKRTPGLGRLAAVFLDDCDLHPRVRTRIELTRELIADGTAASELVESVGATRAERLVSLVLLGDLVTLYRAILDGVDPAEIDVLVELKGQLKARQ